MKRRISFIGRGALLSAAFLLVTSSAAFAQLSDAQSRAVTGQANPARVQEQFQGTDIPSDVSPDLQVRQAAKQKAPPGAEGIRFTLNSINIDGVSVYSAGQLQALYARDVGTEISLADLYGIAGVITNKYRNDGYVLSQVVVPPQTIEGGNVRLRVVEGYIDQITVEGQDQASALEFIRDYASRIKTNQALNVADLERYLLLINDLPGVEARSVLSPSRSQTGAADLRIIVARDMYDALIGADNFGSRYLGHLQFTAAGTLNSFFGTNEAITAQIVVAPDGRELEFFSATYRKPLFGEGTILELAGTRTGTEPGYDLREFRVKGLSHYYSAKIEHPFVRSRARNVKGRLVFDWRDVESKNILEFTRRDRIRSLRAGANFQFMDQFFDVGINSIDFEVSRGLGLLGASDEGDLRLTRGRGDPSYFKINTELQRLQRLSPDFNLLMGAKGQWSANPLLSSEEFGVGGASGYGRGYDPSEIVGDDGYAAKFELQWNEPYPWDFVQDYQLYGFYDYGKVWNQDATSSGEVVNSLSSIGVGVRADFMDETKAGLLVALPMHRDVQTMGDNNPRLFVNVNRSF